MLAIIHATLPYVDTIGFVALGIFAAMFIAFVAGHVLEQGGAQ